VARYRCPYCLPQPLRARRLADGLWVCGRCGDPLQRVPLVRPLPALAGLMVALGFGLAALPPRPGATPEPVPSPPEPLQPEALLQQLAVADVSWTPRAETLPDGRIRYQYKRRQGDPDLSLAQVHALMANPPDFGRERATIAELLALLAQAGVRVQLSQPLKPGAAGEWDPQSRSLRLKPDLLERGSHQFALVLNHEAIHVAQSCRRGGIGAQPRPLGLGEQLSEELQGVLREPVYQRASAAEQRLEREAYANQHRLELGPLLLRSHCRL
jgi:predicted SprT family Zn-dependent metalloprotease